MAYLTAHKIQWIERLIIVTFWGVFFAAPFLFTDWHRGMSWENALLISLPNIPLFIAFLINRLILLPKLFFNRKRLQYAIAVIGLIAGLAMGKEVILGGEFNSPGPPRHPVHLGPASPNQLPPSPIQQGNGPMGERQNRPFPRSAVFSFLCLMIIGMDTGLKSAVKLSRKEREHNILEKENVTNQLAFLRNQVSPHFFMNTLNNIHALIDIDTVEAKEAIIKLSKLMRHLLYDSEVERLPLKKEIEFIKSYVQLMQLRFSSRVKIELHLPNDVPDKTIPPLLFTSILENAFKYGISYHHPSFINISLQSTKDTLRFQVINSNHQPAKKEAYAGIGLQNTRKRLDLLYQDQYLLEVEEEARTYLVKLSLPL